MRSESRRQNLNYKKPKKKLPLRLYVVTLLALVLFVILFVFTKYLVKDWNGKDKLSFVYPLGNDVGLTLYDPDLGEETNFIIPGNTEVDVARGYGTLKIKNVWQLGVNEKVGGSLLAETVTKNFTFPVYNWSQNPIKGERQFIFNPGFTNISVGDRIAIVLYSLKLKSIDKNYIDLGRSQFLKKFILTDGVEGYRIEGKISERLTALFADNSFATKITKFGLIDSTGNPGTIDKVGQILEVLGGKVVSIERTASSDLDCEVFGKNNEAIDKISKLFSCKRTQNKSDLDLEIRFGKNFIRRF